MCILAPEMHILAAKIYILPAKMKKKKCKNNILTVNTILMSKRKPVETITFHI